MVACELLDLRCILVNELVGSVALSVILFAIFYFIIAGKLRLGFNTTIALSIPILLILGLAITGFSVIIAFSTIIVGIVIAFVINKMIGNKF